MSLNKADLKSLPGFVVGNDLSGIYLESDNYVVLDFETSTLDHGNAINPDNQLVLACWWSPKFGGRYKFGNEFEQKQLIEDIHACDLIVAHNAKFEMKWLMRCGVSPEQCLVFCTQIAEKVSNHLFPMGLTSLSKSAARHGIQAKLDWVSQLIKAGICPSEIPKEWLLEYCAQDVLTTRDLFFKQRRKLHREGKLRVHYTKCLFTPVLSDIEFEGIDLDSERVNEEYSKYSKISAKLHRELEELMEGGSPSSRVQFREFLYEKMQFSPALDAKGNEIRTPKGELSTSKAAIDALAPKTAVQRKVIKLFKEMAEVDAKLTKNLTYFKGVCDEREGRCFAEFNQVVTTTLRLSSTGIKVRFKDQKKDKKIQFQNIPREFKRLITCSTPGWNLLEVDKATLEWRVATALCEDPVAMQDIIDKVDVHSVSCEHIYGTVTDKKRTAAKPDTFRPLFGGYSGTKKQLAYFDYFKERYSKTCSEQMKWVKEVIDTKKLVVPQTGMTFYFPKATVTRWGRCSEHTNIHNYPIQYFAFEMVEAAIILLWHFIKAEKLRAKLCCTVHDSCLVKVPDEEVERLSELAHWCFTEGVALFLKSMYNIDWKVPLGTGIKVGTHWEGKDIKKEWIPKTCTDPN